VFGRGEGGWSWRDGFGARGTMRRNYSVGAAKSCRQDPAGAGSSQRPTQTPPSSVMSGRASQAVFLLRPAPSTLRPPPPSRRPLPSCLLQ
jgi:hypothetical protein